MSPIPFLPRLMERFDIGYGGAGTLFAAMAVTLIAMQLPAGVIVDRYRTSTVLFLGMSIVGFSGLLFAFAPSFSVAIAARLLMGVGGPLAEVASISMVSALSSPRERGRTIGFVDMSVGAAYFLALGVLPFLSPVIRLSSMLLIPAALSLAMAIAVFVILVRGQAEGHSVPKTPDPEAHPTHSSHAKAPEVQRLKSRFREVMGNRAVLLLALTAFLGFAAGDAMVVWLPTYLQEMKGYSSGDASTVMTAMLGIYIPAAFLAGRASDAWSHRIRVVQVGSVLMLFAFIGLLVPGLHPLLLVFAPIFGIGYAWNVGPTLTLVTETVERSHMGVAVALTFMCAQLGTAASGSFFGYLADRFAGFGPVWGVGALLLVLRLAVSIVIARRTG